MVSITFVFLVSYTQIPYRNGVIGNIYELTAGFTEQISKSLCRASFIDAGIVINQNSESITTVKDLEIEEESGLKKYDKSKEHRPNPIVQMGLFMDKTGIPLAFCINDGNKNEQTSLIPMKEQP